MKAQRRGGTGKLYSFCNLGARLGGWSTSRPGRYNPGKSKPVPIVQEAGRAPGTEWKGKENLATHRVSIRYTVKLSLPTQNSK